MLCPPVTPLIPGLAGFSLISTALKIAAAATFLSVLADVRNCPFLFDSPKHY